MNPYFSLPMIWYYCLMGRKMIYDDFHSFMLFYFLCLLLTHLILSHIFLLFRRRRKKSLFSTNLRLPHFCIHVHREINMWRRKKFPFLIGNQRSIKITFTESSFRELFPHNLYEVEKIMQFSTTINHYKPENEWMNEIHHYVPLTMQRSPPPPIEQEGKSIFVMKHSKEYFFTLKKVF